VRDDPERRRPSFAERAERAAESFQLREAGCSWKEIAGRLDCSVSTAERAYAAHLASSIGPGGRVRPAAAPDGGALRYRL